MRSYGDNSHKAVSARKGGGLKERYKEAVCIKKRGVEAENRGRKLGGQEVDRVMLNKRWGSRLGRTLAATSRYNHDKSRDKAEIKKEHSER